MHSCSSAFVLLYWLRFREFPAAIKDFFPRPIEANPVVPPRHDRQAVGNLAIAATELNIDRLVRVFLRRDVVDRVGVLIVFMEIAVRSVNADRPECIDWNI